LNFSYVVRLECFERQAEKNQEIVICAGIGKKMSDCGLKSSVSFGEWFALGLFYCPAWLVMFFGYAVGSDSNCMA